MTVKIEKQFISVNCNSTRCPFRTSCTQLRAELVKTRDDDEVDIMFVGQGAGENEDKTRKPFTGPAGRVLREEVKPLLEDECLNIMLDNIIRCRPLDENNKNRAPTETEVAHCIGYLWWMIETYNPTIVVTLGGSATHAVAPHLKGRSISSLRGKSYYQGDCLVYPTYHPAACLHAGGERGIALRQTMQRDIRDAVTQSLGQVRLL